MRHRCVGSQWRPKRHWLSSDRMGLRVGRMVWRVAHQTPIELLTQSRSAFRSRATPRGTGDKYHGLVLNLVVVIHLEGRVNFPNQGDLSPLIEGVSSLRRVLLG